MKDGGEYPVGRSPAKGVPGPAGLELPAAGTAALEPASLSIAASHARCLDQARVASVLRAPLGDCWETVASARYRSVAQGFSDVRWTDLGAFFEVRYRARNLEDAMVTAG